MKCPLSSTSYPGNSCQFGNQYRTSRYSTVLFYFLVVAIHIKFQMSYFTVAVATHYFCSYTGIIQEQEIDCVLVWFLHACNTKVK